MYKTIRITISLTLITMPVAAQSANWYVLQGASGDGSSWANALSTLPSALIRGDTYYIGDGDYAGYSFDDPASGTQTITIRKAVEADHGTDAGWNSFYGDGQAVFGRIFFSTPFYIIDGQIRDESDWSNSSVYGISVQSSANQRTITLSGGDANNITFEHIDIAAAGEGTSNGEDNVYSLSGAQNIVFRNCALRDNDRTHILTNGTPENWLIEYCYIARNNSTSAIHGESWSFQSGKNITVRYNWYEDIEGTAVFAGINDGTMDGLYIYGNVFTNSSSNGIIRIINDASNNNFGTNVLFYNNLIHNHQSGSYSGVSVGGGLGSNETRNNIWWNTKRPNHGGTTLSHNSYWNVESSIDDTSSTAQVLNTGDIFINETNGDFRLTASGASELDRGKSLANTYNTDRFGLTRSADGVWDRGPFEFVGAPPPMPPQALVVQ